MVFKCCVQLLVPASPYFFAVICLIVVSDVTAARPKTVPQDCLKFVRYVPSQWEDDWLFNTSRHIDICSSMKLEAKQAQTWLDVVAGREELELHQRKHATSVDPIWSRYIYQDVCERFHHEVSVPIEPAVGLLRSPHSQACTTDEKEVVDATDREYILLPPLSFANYSPGRKLLFDIGTGTSFQSSLQWLVHKYEQHGITFDDIWCWESNPVVAHDYWSSVPSNWSPRIHFYNTYATADVNGSSPMATIQQVYQPGDYIVVKLDIDNEQVERVILEQLLANADIVNEVHFEMHFDAPEMHPFFGQLETTYSETLALFRQYRSSGVRLHYWP